MRHGFMRLIAIGASLLTMLFTAAIFASPAVAQTPTPVPTPGSGPIVLDSEFADWVGQSFVSDPFGDATGGTRRDLHEFYWANNIDEEYNYWMISRYTTDGDPFDGTNGQTKSVKYFIWIDTNDNGNFEESGDRLVEIAYDPKATEGKTTVKVKSAAGGGWLYDSGNQDWGDTDGEGGLRTEFRVAWTDLNISFGQSTRMYAESVSGKANNQKDRIPDSGDIQ